MAVNSSLIRRDLNDLSNPLNIREFNRQMNWIWKKILGGLDDASFSESGMKKVTSNVERISSDHINIDTIESNVFTSALAKLMVAVVGVCNADYLTAVDGSIHSLLVRDGSADSFSFRNLIVQNAQILRATIGELCIRSSEGDYYILNVSSQGDELCVSKTLVTPTPEQREAGVYNGRQIIETTILADDISTQTLSATLLLADKLDAFRINVETLAAREAFITSLVAQQAFIQQLNTNLIQGNEHITMMVGRAAVWSIDVVSSGSEVLPDGGSATLSAKVYHGNTDKTSEIDASAFTWHRSGDDPAADSVWDASHVGVKSVLISSGESRYNAVYSCDVYIHIETESVLGYCELGKMILGEGDV